MSPLGFILLLGLASQNQPAPAQQSGAERPVPQVLFQGQLNLGQPQWVLRRGTLGAACYTIKTYRFERQDGNAPVLVGTTTCTPANTVRSEQVVNPPKARLVPQ
jgi:hypothetical protein